MKKALLITEKPSVTAAIKRVYESIKDELPYRADFASAAGHLVALCDAEEYRPEWGKPWNKDVLPIIPEEWKKKVINYRFFDDIKKKYDSGNYDFIINAGDAGREGQLIQCLIYEMLGVNIPVMRYWADDTTERTIEKSLKNLIPNDKFSGLSDASYLRMYLDWLIGINFSRAITLSLDRLCKVGRVMTPTLKMICNREEEIENFRPVNYYEVKTKFHYMSGEAYAGSCLSDEDGPTKYAFKSRNDAYKVMNAIKGERGQILDITENDVSEKAPALFNLTDLQKACASRYGLAPKRTLELAQSLYEKQFISYPRTESKCITSEGAGEIPSLLNKLREISVIEPYINRAFSDNENMKQVLRSKKYVDNAKVSDHPALLPTMVVPDIDKLSDAERNVYMLIVRRLVAIFLPPHVTTKTAVTTSVFGNNGVLYKFYSTGKVIKENGWKDVYAEDEKREKETETVLPKMEVNGSSEVVSSEVLERSTTPPLRYTDSTILTAMETAGKMVDDEEYEKILMECSGLGTPATRADILEKLLSDNYVVKEKKFLVPTPEGRQLIRSLGKSVLTSPELTAKFEKYLKDIELNKVSYNSFYKIILEFVKNGTEEFLKLPSIGAYMEVLGTCPLCKSREFVNLSKFYACKGYLEKTESGEHTCSFFLPKEFLSKKITAKDAIKLINGEPTDKKSFVLPDGKNIKTSLVLNRVRDEEKQTELLRLSFPKKEYPEVGRCPDCGGKVLKGKGFFCENWRKKGDGKEHLCDFVVSAKIGVTDVTVEQMREMLEYGETKSDARVRFPNQNTATGKLVIDKERHFVRLKPFEPKPITPAVKCPCCVDGFLLETQWYYECSNKLKSVGCDFCVPKTICKVPVTTEELATMTSPIGSKVHKTGLVNKSGDKWDSDIRIIKDEKRGYVYTWK